MKRILTVLLMFVSMLYIAGTVSAESLEWVGFSVEEKEIMQENYQKYQHILDKLNAEYGTSVRFSTADEIKRVGSEVRKITMSSEEFEEYFRDLIEESLTASAYAKSAEASTKIDTGVQYVSTSITCKREGNTIIYTATDFQKVDSSEPLMVRGETSEETYFSLKHVDGGAFSIGGTVSNAAGFWRFKEVSDCTFTTNVYMHGTILFEPYSSFNRSLIDAGRTCAVSCNGRTYDYYTNATIESNTSRYVEFSASNNEYEGR